MAEKKAKPATKKASSGKTSSMAAVKPKTAKVAATAAAKKSSAPAVKKAVAPVANKKVPVKKIAMASTKPAAKKAAAPVADKKAPVKKTAAKKITTKPTPEERYCMVQTAAYFIAERSGFASSSTDYWAAAEVEIANLLGQ